MGKNNLCIIPVTQKDWEELEEQESRERAAADELDKANGLVSELFSFLDAASESTRRCTLHLIALQCYLNGWNSELRHKVKGQVVW